MRHPHRHRLAALLPLQILAEAPSHSLPFPLAPEALSSALGLELGQSPRPRAKLTPTRNNTLHCGARGPQDPRTYTTQKQRQWQSKQHPPPSLHPSLPLHTRRILCSTSPRSRPQAVLRPSLSRRSVVRTRTCAPDTNPRKSHPHRSLPNTHTHISTLPHLHNPNANGIDGKRPITKTNTHTYTYRQTWRLRRLAR